MRHQMPQPTAAYTAATRTTLRFLSSLHSERGSSDMDVMLGPA